ncbi:MAG: branched-chain amino acid transport system II carrier protein [Candidatus Chromulinivorax sp.]
MKDFQKSEILTIGLAIFSMLFGAGNIIYPIKCGVQTGTENYIGIIGFILTGVILPILGLIAMILFDGNYKRFFNRIGKIPGSIAILYCMLILGPLIAMPRCITVPFEMLKTFIPGMNLPLFSIFFGLITFLITYKESKILSILGNVISPLLLGSLTIIAVKGLVQADQMTEQTTPIAQVFLEQLAHGFQTLDLLGSLFFAYIVLRILKANRSSESITTKQIAMISLQSGIIAGFLLGIVYIAFSFLGAYYAHLVSVDMNGAEMFRIICLHILNKYSMFVIAMAVLMACLSTISALAAVFAEYLHHEIFYKKVSYTNSLIITMLITATISNFGLSNILHYSMPIIDIGYPIITTITICNLGYVLFNFQSIKTPVALTALISTSLFFCC